MGQKTHPIGFRLGFVKTWDSHWYATRDFPEKLAEDLMIRKYIRQRLKRAGLSRLEIERTGNKITINMHTARPGIVIGRKGAEVDKLKEEIKKLTKHDVQLNINEIKRPELDAYLVGENIAQQLVAKISYRRAMKKAIQAAMRMGAEGIRIRVAGRLGGSEMARREQYKEGRLPLSTLRADIDFARVTARTTYGAIGVKVWIFKGEVIAPKAAQARG